MKKDRLGENRMRITDLLDRRSISLDSAPSDKKEALDQIIDLMVKSGFIESAGKENDSMGGGTAMMMRAMYNDTPLHSILSFSTDQLTWEDIQETIRAINEKQS